MFKNQSYWIAMKLGLDQRARHKLSNGANDTSIQHGMQKL